MKSFAFLSTALAALFAGTTSAVVGKNFQQWGFLILENTDYATAEANPTFQAIQSYKNNRLLSNYLGISHPSLPNYLATIAGSTLGVVDDGPPSQHSFANPTILDLLDKKGISWKFYLENYPGGCSLAATNGVAHQYAVKHNPPLYFTAVSKNATRCANVVPATQFQTDFNAGKLPQWWYYVPNLNNDGHDTSTAYTATYLQNTWVPRFHNTTFTKGLAMVMTYDENETQTAANHVYAALIGDAVLAGAASDATAYNHYSLMATVEDNWGLGNIGTGDRTASVIKMLA